MLLKIVFGESREENLLYFYLDHTEGTNDVANDRFSDERVQKNLKHLMIYVEVSSNTCFNI